MAERGLSQLVMTADAGRLETLIDSWTAIYWNTLYDGVQTEK